MIFKTKNDWGNTKIVPGVSGVKTFFNDVKTNYFTSQQRFGDEDTKAINKYATEVDRLTAITTKYNRPLKQATIQNRAFKNTMTNASADAQNFVHGLQDGTNSLNQMTKASKAAELGMKALSVAANMALTFIVSELISGIYQFAQASEDIANSAQEIGSNFKDTEKDISSYKKKVEELQGTINDSSSSIDDVTKAREELMTIQDELIDKYGTEETSIKNITDAVNGQTKAWENLTRQKWVDAKNNFNNNSKKGWLKGFQENASNFFHGYKTNIDRMKKEFGKYSVDINAGAVTGKENRKQVEEILSKFGKLTPNERYGNLKQLTLTGNATEVYNQLLKIQSVFNSLNNESIGKNSSFASSLGDMAESAKEVSEKYKDFWNEYLLNDKILTQGSKYSSSYKNILDDYDKYQETANSKDKKRAKEAKQTLIESISGVMDDALKNGDKDVVSYFENMYPELKAEVDSWRFDIKFEANKDNLKEQVKSDLEKLKGFSTEDLKDGTFNPNAVTKEQAAAYNDLIGLADNYGLSIDELIKKLQKLGLVQSEKQQVFQKSYQDTINRFKSNSDEKKDNQKLKDAKQNLKDEYKKISDWGLDDYADQIKNNTIQTKFGNVDMDKRTIIHWSDELKKTYADALASWNYDPEIGGIDTVFGGSERFGEDLNGKGWEIAFTPILPDGTFLSKDTIEDYINAILQKAYADDGKVTDDELKKIDAQGLQIGNTFVKGIYAGIDGSQNYDNNGNKADLIGRLMHFSGKDGAVQIAKQEIANLENKYGKDGSETIEQFFEKKGINKSSKKLDEFNRVTQGITEADKAIQKWNKHVKESSEIETPKISFDKIWKELDNPNEDSLKSTKKDLLELAEAGDLTKETFQKVEGSSDFLTKLGLSEKDIDKVINKINNLVDSSKQLSTMRSGISSITSAYDEKKDSKYNTVSASTLSSMYDTLGVEEWNKANVKAWENYKKIAGDSSQSLSSLVEAQNKLASAYVNSHEFLSGLTKETQDYYDAQLTEMGITNAHEVTTQALADKMQYLAEQKAYAKEEGEELSKASTKNLKDFIDEQGGADKVSAALFNLAVNKEMVNNHALDFSGDVSNLLSYVETIEGANKALNALRALKAFQDGDTDTAAKLGYSYMDTSAMSKLQKDAKKEVNQAKKDVNKYKTKVNPTVTLGNQNNNSKDSGSKSNSKDKTKATAQIFDFIERRINKLTKTIDYAKSKMEALFSVGAKNNQLDKAIKNTTALVNAQRKAAAKYQAYANKLAGVATKTTKKTVKETTGVGNDIVKSAKKYVGKLRYVWGGASLTNGADCSGFAQQIFKKYGINIPRTSREQWANTPGKRIKNKKDLQKGDLVFFGYNGSSSRIHHVGIYAGNDKFIESPYSGKKVRVSSLSDRIARKHDFVGGVRANAVGKGTTTKQIKVKGLKKSEVSKYVKLIENGSLTKDAIKSIKNEKLKTFIENYQTYYDKAQDAKRAVQENIASIVELNKQKLDNITSHYDTLISKIEATTSRLEAQLSVQKTVNSLYNNGETGSTSTYNSLLTGSSSEIKKYIAEKKAYDKERKSTRRQLNNNLKKSGVSKSQRKSALADFDATTKAQIDNFNTSIFNAESKLYEYAESLAALPWDKATAKIEKLSTKYDILQAKLSNGTSVDGKNNIIDQMNDNLDSQSSTKESALKTDKKNVKNSALWINKNTKIKVTAGKALSKAQLEAIKNIYGKNSKQYKEAVAYNKSVKALNSDKSKAKNTTSWLNKNTKIKVKDDKLISKKQLAKIKKLYGKNSQQYKKAVQHNNSVKALKSDKKNVKKSALWINKNAQIKVTAGKLISKDQLSAIKGIYGKDSKQYKEAVKYNSYVKKMQTDQDDYDKSVEENKTNKAENFKTQFTNIQTGFERAISDIEAKSEHIENAMSVLETKGYKANANYYERLAQISGDTIAKNTDELTALENKLQEGLDNGTIQVGTDTYYEMVDTIASVKKNIDDATLSQAQFLQKVRETNEELKEHARTAISDLNDEAEFYQDILSYKDAYDDNGNMTKEGKSRLALSMTKMSNDIALNNKYNEAIAELDASYNNGNGEIGYDKYYTKRKELISQQRESIKNYYSEVDAIKSLIEEGYNAQKNALSDLISKYTDALDAAKNLHDYEKSIKEKTENIDSIKKRIAALQGNDTEEARQKIQKLQIDLKKAKEDLDETQYEQYINDQKDILNEMQNDYEKFVEEQLKDVDDLIRKLIEGAKGNTQDVLKVLESLANKWDIDLSAILKNDMEKGDFSSVDNKDSNAVDNANKHYDEDKKNEEYNPPISDDDKSNDSSDDEDPDTNSHKKKEQEEEEERRKEEEEKDLLKNILNKSVGSAKNKPLRKIEPGETSKSALNKKLSADYGVVVKSGTGANGQKYIDMFAKAIGLNGSGGGYSKNDKVYQQLKKKYPNLGFSTGGVVGELNKVATDNGDDGWITVQAKERVLTARQNNLWEKWTQNLPELVNIADYLPSMSEYMPKIPDMATNMQVQNGGNSVNVGDISYTMEFPNVTDSASMKEAIKHDTSLQDMLRDVTIGQMKKGNKLGMMKY